MGENNENMSPRAHLLQSDLMLHINGTVKTFFFFFFKSFLGMQGFWGKLLSP